MTPTKLGTYPVVCAELCGLGHAFMRQTAHVVCQGAFDAWVTKMTTRRRGAGAPARRRRQAAAVDAKALFTQGETPDRRHRLRRLPQARRRRHGRRRRPGPRPGPQGQGRGVHQQSIVDPNAEIAKGFNTGIMPDNYGKLLSPAEIDALVKYLKEVAGK